MAPDRVEGVSRKYESPQILGGRIALAHYDGALRQVVAADLGDEEPTTLLSNRIRSAEPSLPGLVA